MCVPNSNDLPIVPGHVRQVVLVGHAGRAQAIAQDAQVKGQEHTGSVEDGEGQRLWEACRDRREDKRPDDLKTSGQTWSRSCDLRTEKQSLTEGHNSEI